jgi:hypothetical protein
MKGQGARWSGKVGAELDGRVQSGGGVAPSVIGGEGMGGGNRVEWERRGGAWRHRLGGGGITPDHEIHGAHMGR